MRKSWRIVLSLTMFVAGAIVHDVVSQPVADAVEPGAPSVHALTPDRILDTREAIGVTGTGPLGAEETIDLVVAGRGGVPASGVGGVVLNVTLVAPTAPTFITVWPTGSTRPNASSLNGLPGDVVANLVVAKVGDDGSVSLFNGFGDVHLVADVTGWIPADSDVTSLNPERLLDTRDGTGGSLGPVGPAQSIDLKVTDVGGVPEDDVGSVLLNVTVTQPTDPSFVTVWPTGADLPEASSLNMTPGQTVPNLVVAKVGDGGRVSLYNFAGSTHLIADVVAWLPVGSAMAGVTPSRVLDSRNGTGGVTGAVGEAESIEFPAVGVGGVPDVGVTAVWLNVTSVGATAPSFVTSWPHGLPRPNASSLNMLPGAVVPNLVLLPVGAGGKVSLFNGFGETHLIADVVAYVSAPEGTTAPRLNDGVRAVAPDAITTITGDPDVDEVIDVTLSSSDDIGVGTILMSAPSDDAPSGLLRRVTAVTSNADGTVTVTTERALLSDAIPAGSFEVDTPLTGGTARFIEAASGDTVPYGAALSCGGAVQLSASADGEVDPSVTANFDWNEGGLKRAQLVAGLDITVDLAASASASVSCMASATAVTMVFTPIVVLVGGFPVVFVPEFTLKVALTGSVGAKVSGTANYGLQITAGVVYDSTNGFDQVSSVTPTATSNWTAEGTARAGLSFTPAIKLAAYGIGGPEASVPFSVDLDVSPCRTPLWQLNSSIKAKVALSLSSFLGNLQLGAQEFTLLTTKLAEGGSPIPDFPGCDKTATVTYYSTEAFATASVRRSSDEIAPYEFEEHTVGNLAAWATDNDNRREGFEQAGVYDVVWTGPDADLAPDQTRTGEFSVSNIGRISDAQASGSGTSANAQAGASIAFIEDETGLSIGLHANATAVASANDDTDVTSYSADADSQSIAAVYVDIVGSWTINATGCPVGVTAYVRTLTPYQNIDLCVPGPIAVSNTTVRALVWATAAADERSNGTDNEAGMITLHLTK